MAAGVAEVLNPAAAHDQASPGAEPGTEVRDQVAAKLAEIAKTFGVGTPPQAGSPIPPVGTFPLPGEAHDTTVEMPPQIDQTLVPADLPDTPERHRQINEPRRRRRILEDPINALEICEYWLLHLSEQPLRAETWTLCIEAMPGNADDRYAQAMNLGMSQLQQYAMFWDACYQALRNGEAKAEQLRGVAEMQKHRHELMDADHRGRILFWLGDRPDVEALVQTERATPTGDVHGDSEHIDGPAGSVQTPAADAGIITGDIGPEMMSPDDAEQVQTIVELFDENHEGSPDDAVSDRALELEEEREEDLEDEGDLEPAVPYEAPDAIRTEPGGEIIG